MYIPWLDGLIVVVVIVVVVMMGTARVVYRDVIHREPIIDY